MKITPPADENERHLWQLRLERQLSLQSGGRWRVDIIAGRYGWYARAVPVGKHMGGRSPREGKALPVIAQPA